MRTLQQLPLPLPQAQFYGDITHILAVMAKRRLCFAAHRYKAKKKTKKKPDNFGHSSMKTTLPIKRKRMFWNACRFMHLPGTSASTPVSSATFRNIYKSSRESAKCLLMALFPKMWRTSASSAADSVEMADRLSSNTLLSVNSQLNLLVPL